MNEGRFAIKNLPAGGAQQQTTDDDEIAFRFEGVHCDVDESDGSFIVRANHRDIHHWSVSRMAVTRTGTIDNKGQYTFSVKSKWAKDNFDRAEHSNADTAYYDNVLYHVNDIELKLRQRKVYIRV